MNKKLEDDRQGRVPCEYALKVFSSSDPLELSKQANIPYDEENKYFTLNMLGRKYRISHPDGRMIDETTGSEVQGYVLKIIVLRYLVNSKGVPPFNECMTYKEVPGGMVYYRNFKMRTIDRFTRLYGHDVDAFREAAAKVGGVKASMGDAAYTVQFVDNVFITYVIWEGDDELEPSSNILFDKNVQYHFNAEDLAVVPDVAIEIMKNSGEMPSWVGLYQKKSEDGTDILMNN